MRDYAYEAALRFANRIRKEDGKRPLKRLPKGDPYCPTTCPLAGATGRRVFSTRSYRDDDLAVAEAPRDVQRFVRKFDDGKYPELLV